MENIELNRKSVKMLEAWDPFELGPDSYEIETADVVAALQNVDNAEKLAAIIQEVYEFSYEEWIPMEDCLEMARQLIALRHQISCNL